MQDIQDTIKKYTHCRGAKKRKLAERFYKKIMTESIPDQQRKMDIQTHGAQKNLNRMDLKKAMQRFIINSL